MLAEIAARYAPPLATGENLFSTQDVENLVRFGGLHAQRNDVIQVDPPQAYGIVQYARTVAMLECHGWPRSALFPHGGNQMALAIAAGFGLGGAESYPRVFGPFGGFADDAELDGGYLTLAERPGIGFDALRHHARARRLMPSTREVAATDRRHRAGGPTDFDGAAAPCATRSESAIVKLRPRGSCDGG